MTSNSAVTDWDTAVNAVLAIRQQVGLTDWRFKKLDAGDAPEMLSKALGRLSDQDKHLFKVHSSERSICFRLGSYLQDCVGDAWDVDCEYNRDGWDPKKQDGKFVTPDLVVHHRGPEGVNWLAMEAKPCWRIGDLEKDLRKLVGYRANQDYCDVLFLLFGWANDQVCTAVFRPIE